LITSPENSLTAWPHCTHFFALSAIGTLPSHC
jgi:hypothetical protein